MSNGELGQYYFHQGTNFSAYKYLGCNFFKDGNTFVYTFRVWAPHAASVSLVGDMTGWSPSVPMERISAGGIFECVLRTERSLEGYAYKYRITVDDGRAFDKADPYAAFSRGGADGASVIFAESNFEWGDGAWLEHRRKTVSEKQGSYLPVPVNIYEVHLGSLLRHEDNSYYTYREAADFLVPYLKFMGYTHVEFLPLAEFPYDGSWGYQVCGFYAPTSRFGNPDDFRYLINELHKNGIGVILDWVPAHFPKDAWGLYEFDGYPLYEYQGKDRQESRSWGTRFFDLGREEVQSFLISNALYFLREFHIDGLRVDAVASMIYLDYDREPGEWVPNCYGTNRNLEAVAFLQKMNSAVFAEFPDALMIAEESASYGGITHPVSEGGLGFNLKWNMGWANDFYDYVMTDPYFRKHKHTALNFPLMYAFTENYVLPISHDEVVHGKLSFIDKMYGEYEDKFRQARAALLLMMTYPGKKMLFMGTEYAQFREWDYENSLEWFMLDYPLHKSFRSYTAALNRFYISRSELWEIDFKEDGFEWILADESEKNLVAFKRKNLSGDEITVVINFSGAEQQVSLPLKSKKVEVLFETSGASDAASLIKPVSKGKTITADVTVRAFSGIVYKEKNKNKRKINQKEKI